MLLFSLSFFIFVLNKKILFDFLSLLQI